MHQKIKQMQVQLKYSRDDGGGDDDEGKEQSNVMGGHA